MDMQNPRKVDGLEFQPAGNEVLVHDAERQKIHVLNQSAHKLLEMCDGSPVDTLVDAMMPSDDFDRARVQRDVETVIAQFYELGLVRSIASAGRTPQ